MTGIVLTNKIPEMKGKRRHAWIETNRYFKSITEI